MTDETKARLKVLMTTRNNLLAVLLADCERRNDLMRPQMSVAEAQAWVRPAGWIAQTVADIDALDRMIGGS